MNFDDIRPYFDSEVPEKIAKLTQEPQFQQIMEHVNPGVPYEMLVRQMKSVKSVNEFQAKIIVPLLENLLSKTSSGLKVKGLENLEKEKSYLFVSTHRDIVLDSALMNFALLSNGFTTAEIAIGDNLMTIPWIVDLVKLNKTFIVKRSLPNDKKYEGSLQLSSYIRTTIKEKKESIWIAQKAGRSKDGNDLTNPSLLKMFNLSGESPSIIDNLKELNICPISVAYEYNPCDVLTMPELMTKAKGEKYEKAPMEDIIHMGQGMEGQKGSIEVSFGKPINQNIDKLNGIKNKNELFAAIASLIDDEIHQSYALQDTNYLAYDILKEEGLFKENYSEEEKKSFLNYIEEKTSKVVGDPSFVRDVFLKMYAYPVENKLKDL